MLRGIGTTLALPWLEAMGPMTNWANGATPTSKAAPNRMAFLYVPNGKNMADWTPKTEGELSELPSILEPLAAHKRDFSILTGLTADKARAHGDGGGDHARALSAFLTGAQPRKTDGTDIRAGISVDQVAAARVGEQTRLASLEIGTEAGAMAGNCDSGYSCVYSSTMSWRSATQPLPKEVNPKLVFERLFGAGAQKDRAQRDAQRKSVLDLVKADFNELNGKLGVQDQRKLDEYFSAIRDIETRIERAGRFAEAKAPSTFAAPAGVPASFQEHIRLMCDLMVLAFQTDTTRVSSYIGSTPNGVSYPELGFSDTHHSNTHHGFEAEKVRKVAAITAFNIAQFAYMIKRMQSIREGDGTLLDNCIMMWGSGLEDGNKHARENLPFIVAGRGGGSINTGRFLPNVRGNQGDLLTTLLGCAGVPLDRPIGIATKQITEIRA